MAEATTMKILKRGIDVCSFEPFRGSKRIRTSYKLNLEYNNGGTFKGATVSCAQGEHKSKSSSALSVCNQICYQTASAIVDAPAQKHTRLTVKTQGAALPLPWHAPWKNYRVISGHTGWVRAIAFDPGNLWFCTGSADQTIRIWDVATGRLKITLTGHIGSVRALAVSPHHTYMFSAGDDKQVKCWDLEQNKVIRSYHGHLSGVRCLSLHPTLDSVLFTGGRDSVCRVWDVRTKMGVHTLSGHTDTVSSLLSRPTDPQIITGSQDGTIRLWDIRHGKTMVNLTHHKKGVRAMAELPKDHSSFASASVDNIKKFNLPKGDFVMNMSPQQKTIINALDVNEDGVMATGGDNGSLWLWDWKHGYNFQQEQTIVQPGSLESECCIYALSFDKTGSRLVTCEADKTIKMWKQDESATPQTHPIAYKMPKGPRRF